MSEVGFIGNAIKETSDNERTDAGIQNVHLTSGEDIIGHVYVGRSTLLITQPMMPQFRADETGQKFQFGLIPYRFHLAQDKGLIVGKMHVVFHTAVNEDVVRLYTQYTSNIVIAPANVLDGPGPLS
jgi:hypothetical protein